MKEFEDLLTTIAWTGIAIGLVVFLARLAYAWHTRAARRRLDHAAPLVRTLHLLSAVGLLALGCGLVTYLFVLLRGSTFMPISLKVTFAGVVLAYLALEIVLHGWLRLPSSRWVLARGVVGALLIWGLAGLLLQAFRAARWYPSVEESVLLQPPFDGEWVATGAGATASTNHHHRIPSQRYALDIAKACADGRLFRGEGKALEESCTFGATVRSPANGVVSHIVDGLPDLGSRSELAGNHVIIRLTSDRYVALAHLQQGSVLVSVGDMVRVGQEIARAGNSGNSDFPHLHVHVQDGPTYDLRESRSFPFRFTHAEVKRYLFWSRGTHAALLNNDRIRPADDPR